MSGFSSMPLSITATGSYIGISSHDVDQHSDWPAAEAVLERPIKFSQWKIHPAMRPVVKILWPLMLFYDHSFQLHYGWSVSDTVHY